MGKIRLFNSLIHGILATLLVFSSHNAWVQVGSLQEIPWGCDLFGHVRIAEEFRESFLVRRMPEFRLIHPQITSLIHWFQSTNSPTFQWEEIVSPHAHHYVERNKSVVDQYPPGTGLLMALFPQGKGIEGLNRAAIVGSLLLGLTSLFLTWRRKAWIAAGMVGLSTFYVSDILIKAGYTNYSFNAMIIPIIATAILALAARNIYLKRKAWTGNFIAFLAGICGGISVLVRTPTALQLPGWLFLLPRGTWVSFGTGVFISGILPLAWYQQSTVGAWWASNYNTLDASLPNWKAIGPNFRFYFTRGLGSQYFLIPLVLLLGAAGFFLLRNQAIQLQKTVHETPSPQTQGMSRTLLWIWGVSTLFFLTHNFAVEYYLVPAHLTLVWLLSCHILDLEPELNFDTVNKWNIKSVFFQGLAYLPLIYCLILGTIRIKNHVYFLAGGNTGPEAKQFPIDSHLFSLNKIPPELLAPESWIWADVTSGAFWTLAKKPAFRVRFRGNPELRSRLFAEIHQRKERQYLIMDGNTSTELFEEIQKLGAKLERRGEVFSFPYFAIHW